MRKMVDLQSVGHASYSTSFILILVSNEADFVASLDQTLGQLISMSLNSTKLWEGEISAN